MSAPKNPAESGTLLTSRRCAHMQRFTVTDLIMGTSLITILLVLSHSDVGGKPFVRVQTISFSPDGQRIVFSSLDGVTLTNGISSLFRDVTQSIGLIDCEQGNQVRIIHSDSLTVRPSKRNPALVYMPLPSFRLPPAVFLGNHLVCAIAPPTGIIRLYPLDGDLGSSVNFSLENTAAGLSVSSSGKLLAITTEYGLRIVDVATATRIMRTRVHFSQLPTGSQVAFSADESLALVSYRYPSIVILDLATKKKSLLKLKNNFFQKSLSTIPAAKTRELNKLHGVSFVGNELLFTCSYFGVQLYDLSGNLVSTISDSQQIAVGCVSANGATAAWVESGRLVTYDLARQTVIRESPLNSATCLALSPDGTLLAAGIVNVSGNPRVSVIDVRTGKTRFIAAVPTHRRISWLMAAGMLIVWILLYWRRRS